MTPVFRLLRIPERGATMPQATVVDDLYLPAFELKPLTEIVDLRRSAKRIDGRARLRIEDLREENDELRRFARSVAGADPLSSRDAERSDADADADAEKKIASRLFFHDENDGAAATAREARRLEAVVSATTRHPSPSGGQPTSQVARNRTTRSSVSSPSKRRVANFAPEPSAKVNTQPPRGSWTDAKDFAAAARASRDA